MLRGVSSSTAAGRLSRTGADCEARTGANAMTGFLAGGSGTVSPFRRYLENSALTLKYFSVVHPASLIGAS
jgi:hypothetical protein